MSGIGPVAPAARGGLRATFKEAAALKRPAAGIALYTTLTVVAVQSPGLSPLVGLGGASVPFSALTTAASALTFALIATAFLARRWVPRGRRYLACALGAVTLGILANLGLLFATPIMSDGTHTALVLAADVVAGAGLAFLGIEWIRVLGTLGPRKAFACMVPSSLLTALLYLGYVALPLAAALAVSATFPWLSAACLDYPRSRNAKVFRHGAQAQLTVPWRLSATVVVQGVSAGFLQAAFLQHPEGLGYLPTEAAALATATALALVTATALRLDADQLVYKVGFPAMALGCLLFIVAGSPFWPAALVHETGSRFVMIMTWVLMAWLINQGELSANWVYPFVLGSFLLGRTAALLLGFSIAPWTPATAAVVLFLLLLCAVLMLGNRSPHAEWGGFRVVEDVPAADPFEEACRSLALEAGLTEREGQILELMARGRNSRYLCDALGISANTAKYHVRNIYRKLDVHTQQELMSEVEVRGQALASGRSALP